MLIDKSMTRQKSHPFGKICKRHSKFGKVADGTLINVIKFEKLSNVTEISWLRPVKYSTDIW